MQTTFKHKEHNTLRNFSFSSSTYNSLTELALSLSRNWLSEAHSARFENIHSGGCLEVCFLPQVIHIPCNWWHWDVTFSTPYLRHRGWSLSLTRYSVTETNTIIAKLVALGSVVKGLIPSKHLHSSLSESKIITHFPMSLPTWLVKFMNESSY